MKLDLHVHSTASDGSVKPPRLARMAAAGGIDVLAVADHDTTAGVRPAIEAAPPGLRIVPAIEISCSAADAEIHVLGYFIDPDHEAMVAYADRVAGLREQRMRDMLARLAGLGIDLEYAAVRDEAGDEAVLGRPHLARALVAAGAVPSVGRAFELYLSDYAPAWVPIRAIGAAEAISLIHEAGGIAVWAHPPGPALESGLDELVPLGLDGVECIRSKANGADIDRALRIARSRSLVPTAGSDWHGAWHGRLGDFTVRAEEVPEFVELLEQRRPAV